MKTYKNLIALFIVLNAFYSNAQEKKEKVYNTKKWVHSVGIAVNKYWYSGFPPGRNEINFKSLGGKVDQSSGNGFVLDIKIQRKINKNYFGFILNYYSDFKNSSWGGSIDQIKRDSLKWLSVYDGQAYFNFGLSYERELYRFWKNRLGLNASLAAGYSNNRTPHRLEYDYFLQGFFKDDDNNELVRTKFKDGYFINPSINCRFNTSKNHGVMVELSAMFQQHKAVKQYETEFAWSTLDGFNDSNIKSKYSVTGFQLRFNYFF